MTDELEQRLAADRSATRRRIEQMRAELTAVAAAVSGSNIDDEHDPEGSTVAFERQQLAGLLARAEDHVTEVDAALVRLRAGSYGQCESCGRPIGAERLASLPTARLCIECAARRRP